MPDLKELVKGKLKSSGSDTETISLCDDIFNWYGEGGPDLVRFNVNNRLKEIKSQFKKDAKEIKDATKDIIPKSKKKKKRGR